MADSIVNETTPPDEDEATDDEDDSAEEEEEEEKRAICDGYDNREEDLLSCLTGSTTKAATRVLRAGRM